MEEAPFGARRSEHEMLYRQPGVDDRIEKDCVSPAIEGYFRIPAIWAGEAPELSEVTSLNPPIHHQIVLNKVLKCGITARVQRDGLFLFDFSSWPAAPLVVIPGYTKPEPPYPHRATRAHHEAEESAERNAVLRAQVMNAHQACLTTAESVVRHRGAGMGFPVTAWNTHKAISFSTPPSYHDDTENLHALAHNVLNNKDRVARDRPLGRRVIELDVIDYSLNLLDKILSSSDSTLVQLVEGTYMAACRNSEKRFGEALTLAWSVCEQLVSFAWSGLLDEVRASGEGRMSKERRAKLGGRDYTASVMVEVLEVSGRIDREIYRLLEVARKARNKWSHEMRSPKESEVYICLRAAEALLKNLKGIHLSLQPGGRGGVPQWPIWMWDKVRASGGP